MSRVLTFPTQTKAKPSRSKKPAKVLPMLKREIVNTNQQKKHAHSAATPVDALAEMMKMLSAAPVSPTYRDATYTEKFNELMMLINNIDLKLASIEAAIKAIRFHEGRPTG